MKRLNLLLILLFLTLETMAQVLTSHNEFENGSIYYFETSRGVMAATESSSNLVSSAKTTITDLGQDNPYCQWTVYKTDEGKYYLYNIGKGMFMGTTTTNNGAIPFTAKPINDGLVFKAAAKSGYPIMFSCNTNTGIVNHSANYAEGLIYWNAGWDQTNDDGSCHKVTRIKTLNNDILEHIESLVLAANSTITYKAEVEGWTSTNPNTHFGGITLNCDGAEKRTTLTIDNITAREIKIDISGNIALSFTREYRGFDFVGFCIDGADLGTAPTLTTEHKNKLANGTPLVVKFKTDNTGDVTLFYDDAPKSYRIPAIATTGTGRIIAVTDYRHNLDDIGRDNHGTGTKRIDLVARTSDNNGATWSTIQTIAAGDNSKIGSYERAFGDAAIAAYGENILVMAAAGDVLYTSGTTSNPNKMARIFSEDNGETWSIEEMTTKMYSQSTSLIPSGGSAFFGSGKLAVDPNFNGTGVPRIYGALLVRIGTNGYNNFGIYSDDLGKNWHILGGSQTPVAAGDEPKIEILPNGQILLSARRVGGRIFNIFTYTDKATNAGTWGNAVNGCNNGGGNGTNGEIMCIDAKKIDGTAVKLLLQSQPKGGSGQYDRKDVTIWYKEVSAEITNYTPSEIAGNWIEGKQVSTLLSSYSTMSLQNDGKIAFFFEEAPCYEDNYAKGYSMVYLPLSVEEITNNRYYSLTTELPEIISVNTVLTDANGNEYYDMVQGATNTEGIESVLTAKHPYITLGTSGSLEQNNDGTFTYTNTVTLPFTVSNYETTVWHNIYWPANTNENGYPVYMSASTADDIYVPKVTESNIYGNSSYNTLNNNSKISWAIYSVDNSFAFTFKNKLTGKYIKATNVSGGNAQNVEYVEEADATTFSLLKNTGSYRGEYSLAAEINGRTGYLCSTSATGYHYTTHYSGNGHQGAWVKFVATDFENIIAQINDAIVSVNCGIYSLATGKLETYNTIQDAMTNSGNVKLNTLNSYLTQTRTLFDGATLNSPQTGYYYRIAYDYGTNGGELYMQGVATEQFKNNQISYAAKFDNATGAESIWYYDGGLMSYTAGKYIKEQDNYRGLQAVGSTKQNATFSISRRNSSKFCINLGSYLHANVTGSNYYSDHCSGNNCAQHDFTVTAVSSLPIKITAAGYATLYAPVALVIPSDVTAHTVTISGEWAILNKIEGGIIPARTGVVLIGNAGTYNFAITTTDIEIANNDLRGTVADTYISEDAFVLTLDNDESGVCFGVATKNQQEGTAFLNNSHKAYLPKPANAVDIQSYSFRFGDDTTGISETKSEAGNVRGIYDITGRRIEKIAVPGIYIIDGKKTSVK